MVRNSAVAWNWPFGFSTKKANSEQKRQLRSVFWRQFRATGQLRTVFHTSFTFRTIRANLKQNTVAQSDLRPISSNSTCFLQVLSKTANQISWILLTTHTNLGKLTVASPLSHRSSVKRPIASNRTAAPRWEHFFRFLFSSRFLWKIYVFLLLLTKGANFKQN